LRAGPVRSPYRTRFAARPESVGHRDGRTPQTTRPASTPSSLIGRLNEPPEGSAAVPSYGPSPTSTRTWSMRPTSSSAPPADHWSPASQRPLRAPSPPTAANSSSKKTTTRRSPPTPSRRSTCTARSARATS
jgi:hypothetical protein